MGTNVNYREQGAQSQGYRVAINKVTGILQIINTKLYNKYTNLTN